MARSWKPPFRNPPRIGRREDVQPHPFMLPRHRVVERRVLVRNDRQSFERRTELVAPKSAPRHADMPTGTASLAWHLAGCPHRHPRMLPGLHWLQVAHAQSQPESRHGVRKRARRDDVPAKWIWRALAGIPDPSHFRGGCTSPNQELRAPVGRVPRFMHVGLIASTTPGAIQPGACRFALAGCARLLST